MSVQGIWLASALPDAAVRDLRARHPGRPPDDRRTAETAWWEASGDDGFFEPAAPGRSAAALTAAGLRFADFACRIGEDDDRWDALVRLAEAAGAAARFLDTTRSTNPLAALLHGLGPARAGLLPGCLGEFLLTADETAAALPEFEEALALAGADRERFVTRARMWMEAVGDAFAFDPAGLLDGPLRTIRGAVATRQGVGSLGYWY